MLRIVIFMIIALAVVAALEKGYTGKNTSASSIASGFEKIGESAWNSVKGLVK